MDADRHGGLLSAGDVATRLGVSLHAVRSWTRAGRLRAIRLGRRVRFDPRDIEALIKTGGLGTTRTPLPRVLRAAERYLTDDCEGDREIAHVALDLIESRDPGNLRR
jgi:excisionase family DNA binding protein